ncbi:MAG: hypothetical protein EA394_02615 [Bacteroidia bacterium]|nr:MAG: hypothetical protein EA394_02615 [Bacteroidia bacterium]
MVLHRQTTPGMYCWHLNMNHIPLELIHIEPDGFHVMFHASVNGLKANTLIDTGASKTILDFSRAAHYLGDMEIKPFSKLFTGVGSNQIKTYISKIHTMRIGQKEFSNLDVLLIDLAAINQTYAIYDLPRIDMVLGGDLLVQMKALIDYPGKKLIVH